MPAPASASVAAPRSATRSAEQVGARPLVAPAPECGPLSPGNGKRASVQSPSDTPAAGWPGAASASHEGDRGAEQPGEVGPAHTGSSISAPTKVLCGRRQDVGRRRAGRRRWSPEPGVDGEFEGAPLEEDAAGVTRVAEAHKGFAPWIRRARCPPHDTRHTRAACSGLRGVGQRIEVSGGSPRHPSRCTPPSPMSRAWASGPRSAAAAHGTRAPTVRSSAARSTATTNMASTDGGRRTKSLRRYPAEYPLRVLHDALPLFDMGYRIEPTGSGCLVTEWTRTCVRSQRSSSAGTPRAWTTARRRIARRWAAPWRGLRSC